MTSNWQDELRGRIRQPDVYAAPSMQFDLAAELKALDAEQPWQAGRTAKTMVKYPDLRIVLVALKAGARVVRHEANARISMQVLSGRISVQVHGRTLDLAAGQVVALDDGIAYEIEAEVDSAFLLTIAWTPVHAAALRLRPVNIREQAERVCA